MSQSVDYLLTNAIVITINDHMDVFEPGAVAVSGNKIVAVGTEKVILESYSSTTMVDCSGKIVMPGLINAHTHVPMTLLRGLADDLRLDVWLLGYMMPVEREFVSPEFVALGTKLAAAEMIKSGITCFADMYYFEHEVAQAAEETGMRAVCAQTVLKFPSPDAQSYEESLAMARDFIQNWKDNELIVPAVGPHAPYTCTDEILKACTDLAKEFDVPLHIHIAETAGEVENMRRDRGMPVVPYVKKQTLLEAKVIAAHCVHIDDGEMHTLAHANAGVVHNPSSNLKLASGFARVDQWLEHGLKVGIGTDGPSSNNDLDMFEEIRLAAFLGKSVSNDPTALPAKTVVRLATKGGAEALHIDNLTGSLEPGKRADLILVDISPIHNVPRYNHDANGIYSQLIYSTKARDVTDVMINGKWVLQNRMLTNLDEAALIKQSQVYAEKIDAFLLEREKSVLSKLIAIGGAAEEESFEVQIKVPIVDVKKLVLTIDKLDLDVIRKRHYRQYDTYFSFSDPDQGYIRYREDHFINKDGDISSVRSRLTHIGPNRELSLPGQVVLSRSRYLAPASQSLRFYREYFTPEKELEIEKERLRYLIRFNGDEFFINLDHFTKPDLGCYLEIKSRTWSRRDAENKARLAGELIQILGLSTEDAVNKDYIALMKER